MIEFIDLNTGNIYDGTWYEDINNGFIHKFEGEQSINLIYSLLLCFICDKQTVNIELTNPEEVFSLYNPTDLKPTDQSGTPLVDELVISDVKYYNIFNHCTRSMVSTGVKYDSGGKTYYIHNFNIVANSNNEGEYIGTFTIDNQTFKISADFYGENEALKINLGNYGLDLPESILKAIYSINVREDKADYITLNRKWKELLSNYWNMVANKGSYKSLMNSLRWFEYGDLVEMRELWFERSFGSSRYQNVSLINAISDNYEEYILARYKTTYMSLNLALQTIEGSTGVKYDGERNPILHNIVADWTYHDLSLKMSMLGNFFETYFMPVHLDLIQSTIENIAFTNTIKLVNSTVLEREDYINNFQFPLCNILDDAVYYLNDMSVLVGVQTKMANHIKTAISPRANAVPMYFKFGNNPTDKQDNNVLFGDGSKILVGYAYKNDGKLLTRVYYDKLDALNKRDEPSYENVSYLIGVDKEINQCTNFTTGPAWDDDARTFFSQNYTGPGALVNFTLGVVLEKDDYIKKEVISFIPDDAIVKDNPTWLTNTSHDIFKDRRRVVVFNEETNAFKDITTDIVDVKFHMLCREARDYEIRIQLESAAGTIVTKNIKFKVVDPKGNRLYLYKICHKPYPYAADGSYLGHFTEFKRTYINNTTFGRQSSIPGNTKHKTAKLYIPTFSNSDMIDYNGVCLNHILILLFESYVLESAIPRIYNYIKDKYFIFTRYTGKTYFICVSKAFWEKFEFSDFKTTFEKELKDNKGKIFRDDYGYFPEFHELVPFGGITENNVTTGRYDILDSIISDRDTLCVIPDFSYGASIGLDKYEWVFKNVSTGKEIKMKASIKEPIIGNDEKAVLPAGYYNIIFKYSLTNDKTIHTMEWDSAFIKK